jgi:hypothetical protein
MVNGKEKKSIKFYTRTSLAKRLGLLSAAIDRLMLRDIIVPDAWVIQTSSLEQPLFSAVRLDEIRAAVETYFAHIEAARLHRVQVAME